jgi:predicted DNA-binding protein
MSRTAGRRAWHVLRRDTLSAMQTDIRSVDLRVRLRPAEALKLRELAAKDDEPVSAVVRRAIRRYIEQVEGGK